MVGPLDIAFTSVYLPLVLLAAVTGMGFALFAWLHRDVPGARPLTIFLVAASFWAVAEGVAVANGGLETMRLLTKVGLSLSVVVPLAWLATVLEYTDDDRWLEPRVLAPLLVEPVAFVALVWTNDSHGSVVVDPDLYPVADFIAYGFEFGLAFWGHQAYSSLLLTVGVALLGRGLWRGNRRYRLQRTVLIGAIAVPILANALYIFGFLPSGLDPNGVAYVLAGIVVAVALLEADLFGFAPVTRDIGREAVLAELDDAVVILDDGNRVVDLNPAAEELLGPQTDCLGRPISQLRPALAAALADAGDRADVELEFQGRVRFFDVSVSEISRGYGAFSGRVVSLRDVTEPRQREQRLDVLNRLLRHNVRNELNLVRGNIELARTQIDDGGQAELADAIEAVDEIVARSDKVGRLSRLLEIEGSETVDIARELRGERAAGTFDGPDGQITLDLPEELPVAGGESLVAAFDELISNAIAHNDAAEPRVTVSVDDERSDEEHVVVAVADNGPGIDRQEIDTLGEGRETPLQHSSGVGLWLVTWVVRRAGGTVSFENTAGGCTVRVRLPRPAARTDSRLSEPDTDPRQR